MMTATTNSQLQMHMHALIQDIGGIGWTKMGQEALLKKLGLEDSPGSLAEKYGLSYTSQGRPTQD